VIELPGLRTSLDQAASPALNDVSFTRRPHHRVAELSYRLGGREVGHIRCDGLVAATPVGSTGYNLANGGPILAWGVEGYVVSFIAPHTLTTRPLVVAPGDVLHVHNLSDRDPVDVAFDGVLHGRLEPRSEVEVRFRDGLARLAQTALPGSHSSRARASTRGSATSSAVSSSSRDRSGRPRGESVGRRC
jgi:NAD+ kinase